jgi:cytochrome P450/ferredoxin-NADP reductase
MNAPDDLSRRPAPAASPTSPTGCPVSAAAAAFTPFDPAFMQDPGGCLRWSREQEPVFWSPQLRHWVVTRYADAKAVLRDNILFSPSNVLEKITPATPEVMRILQSQGFAMNRTLVNEDEPEHMLRRRLLMDAFLPARLGEVEPLVRQLARQAIDRFIGTGRADLVREMFHPIPLQVALRFLGVPQAGSDKLLQIPLAHTLNTWGRPSPAQQAEHAHNLGRFWAVSQEILHDMMARPDGQGWMFDAIGQHRLHPQTLPESYLRSMMMAILSAAHESTSHALANAARTLLSQRQAWQEVCNRPAVLANAVEECLRVAGSAMAWRRRATADTALGGVALPKGARLLIVLASANVDPRHFQRPDEVDVYREDAIEHLSFGYGAHQCMGKNIARIQMRVVLEELTQRLPHMALCEQTLDYLPNTTFRGPHALWAQWDPERIPRACGKRGSAAFSIGPPTQDSLARPLVALERHEEGQGLARFVLADPQARALPAWTAGAHVDLISAGFRRAYSLCGPSEDRHRFEVVVQRQTQGQGGSRHFFDTLHVGSALQFSGPRNFFALDETAAHTVLIAGGIGITPIAALADRLRALGRSYALHYAGQARERMALLCRLEHDHGPALTLYVKEEGQRMNLAALLSGMDAHARVYACGPQRMTDALEALASGWPEGVLRLERFQSGDAAHMQTHTQTQTKAFEAELQDSQVRVQVRADQSLLQALQAAGLDVPRDCGEGLCGACEVAVVAGTIDHRDKVLSKAERAAQQRMLACCSRAAGDRIVLAL